MVRTSSLAVRRLIVFRGDLHATDWYRSGATRPKVSDVAGVAFRWVRTSTDGEPGSQYAQVAERKGRLARGDACLLGYRRDSQHLVYHLWVAEGGAHIPWIFGHVSTRPGELLVYDVWVDQSHRGGALHSVGAALACEEALRRTRRHIVAGIERRELVPYQRFYRSAGIGNIAPVRSIVAVRLPGRVWRWEWTARQ